MKKRILSMLLAIVMVCSLLPTVAFAVETTYDLWVGGVQITSANKDDITTAIGNAASGTAKYDPDSNILTLDNFSYEGEGYEYVPGVGCSAIYFNPENENAKLTIELVGINTVIIDNSECISDDIYIANGNLIIEGNGSLTATGDNGIYARGNISISGGEVKATATYEYGTGIYAYGDIDIYGGNVEATGSSKGIYAYEGDISISGGEVKATATYEDGTGIYTYGDIDIDGSKVEANGFNNGILAEGNIDIDGGKVEANGGYVGIGAYGNITISGGKVEATANDEYGIGIVANGVIVKGGTVEVISTGESGYGTSDGVSCNGDFDVYAGEAAPGELVTSPTTSTYESKYVKIVPPHADHCVCGATHAAVGDHKEAQSITWTEWNGTDDIAYTDGVAYVYLSADAERSSALTIPTDYKLYLCLNGHELKNTASNQRVIDITGGTLNLTDCGSTGTITGGSFTSGVSYKNLGAGVKVTNGAFNMYAGAISANTSNGNGGGVYNEGTFTMYGGVISGNTAEYGGGVYNKGTFTMYGGEISGNKANFGGGVYNNLTFTMLGGVISGNTAKSGGGMECNDRNTIIAGGSIINNTANGSPSGGISAVQSLTLSGTPVISGNKYGGNDGTFDIYKNHTAIRVTEDFAPTGSPIRVSVGSTYNNYVFLDTADSDMDVDAYIGYFENVSDFPLYKMDGKYYAGFAIIEEPTSENNYTVKVSSKTDLSSQWYKKELVNKVLTNSDVSLGGPYAEYNPNSQSFIMRDGVFAGYILLNAGDQLIVSAQSEMENVWLGYVYPSAVEQDGNTYTYTFTVTTPDYYMLEVYNDSSASVKLTKIGFDFAEVEGQTALTLDTTNLEEGDYKCKLVWGRGTNDTYDDIEVWSEVVTYTVPEPPHEHCICGATHAPVGDHTAEDEKTFTAVSTYDELVAAATNGGNYYLTNDIEITNAIEARPQEPFNLCLNGNTLFAADDMTGNIFDILNNSLTLTDCVGGGKLTGTQASAVYVWNTFNMYGGAITENNGTGVHLAAKYAVFNMYGGEITNNKAYYGAGIYHNGGPIRISGGTIAGNVAQTKGGAIFSRASGIEICGNPVIAGNYVNSGADGEANQINNIDAYSIEIVGPMTEGASIGMTLVGKEFGYFATDACNSSADFSDYFFSDKGYPVYKEDDTYYFGYRITKQPSDTDYSVEVNSTNGASYQWCEVIKGAPVPVDDAFFGDDGTNGVGIGDYGENGWSAGSLFTGGASDEYFIIAMGANDTLTAEFFGTVSGEVALIEINASVSADVSRNENRYVFTTTTSGYYLLLFSSSNEEQAPTVKATLTKKTLKEVDGQRAATLDTGDLPAGTYACRVTWDMGTDDPDDDYVLISENVVFTPPHTHCICGEENCSVHGADVEWTPWESANSLPTTAGNYYLAVDVSTNVCYDLNSNINLCLNGHKITYTVAGVLWDVKGGTLGICDCSEGGKITVSSNVSSIAYLGGNAVFNLYGGHLSTVEGNTILNGYDETHSTVNVYGGTIHSAESAAIGAAVMTLNLYGGTISSDGWDALIINTNAAKANLLGNVTFSYPSSKSAIKTRESGTIDASGYTGGNIAVYYAKSYPSIGDIVVTNVTDANAGKFDLSTENDSACILKRSGNNLVYGKYSYEVAFNTNGGSAVGSQTVLSGDKVTKPVSDPTKEGYTFVGWYKEAGCENAWNFSTDTVTTNTTLYAKWTVETYTVTVTANPNGGGSVSGGGEVEKNSSVTLTATANKGYKFVNWTKGGVEVSTNARYTFTATETAEYVANFVEVHTHCICGGSITVDGHTHDITSPTWTKWDATASANYRTTLPTSGYYVLTDDVTLSNTHTVTGTLNLCLNGKNIYYAVSGGSVFKVNANATLNITDCHVGGDNGINIKNEASDFNGIVNDGTVTVYGGKITGTSYGIQNNGTLTVAGGKVHSTGNSGIGNMPNGTVNVVGGELTGYTNGIQNGGVLDSKTWNSLDGGIVYVSGGKVTSRIYNTKNGKMTISGTAEVTHILNRAILTVSGGKVNSIKNETDDGDLTVTGGNFTSTGTAIENSATLKLSGNPTGNASIYTNQPFTVTGALTGANNSIVVNMSGTGVFAIDGAPYISIFKPRYSDKIIVVDGADLKMVEPTVTITASAFEGGGVEGGGSYNYGESVTLTATPAAGYQFVGWMKGNKVVSTDETYTFTAEESCTLVANFEVNTYGVTVSANPGEGGTVTGGGEVEKNSSVTLTATANEGYKFVNWTKGGVVVSTNARYTFTATEDAEYVANFVEAHEHKLCQTDNCTLDHNGDADGVGHDAVDFVPVSTQAELQYFATNGGSVYLANDIQLTRSINVDGAINVTGNLTLCLNGYTLKNTAPNQRVIDITGGILNLTDCGSDGTITGGSFTDTSKDEANMTGSGVRVKDNGTFHMYGGTITGNSSVYSGTVAVGYYNLAYGSSDGTFHMYGGSITGNTAKTGGGIFVREGSFTMHDGTISDNTATGSQGAGGVYVHYTDTFTMHGGTISGNTASGGNGGGVFGGFIMTGGTISGNTTNGNGGGVYGTVTMTGGRIAGNIASNGSSVSGSLKISASPEISGDVYLGSSGKITITGALNLPAGYKTIQVYSSKDEQHVPITVGASEYGVITDGEQSIFFAQDTENTKIHVHNGEVCQEGKPTVTFNTYGGDPTPGTQTLPFEGGKATAPAEDPTRNRYVFSHWCGDEDCTDYTNCSGWNFDTVITESKTIYAIWEPITVTITSEPGKLTAVTSHAATAYQWSTLCDADYPLNTAKVRIGTGWSPTLLVYGLLDNGNWLPDDVYGDSRFNICYFNVYPDDYNYSSIPAGVLTVTLNEALPDGCVLKLMPYEGETVIEPISVSGNTYKWATGEDGDYILAANAPDGMTMPSVTAVFTVPNGAFNPIDGETNAIFTNGENGKEYKVTATFEGGSEITSASEVFEELAVYTVTVTANPTLGGTVTGGGTYNYGSTVTLTAAPNEGYKFVNWTKGGVEISTNATYSFTATENAEYVANFEEYHTHCVCGATHAAIGTHMTEENPTWIAISSASDFTKNKDSGYYYLTNDIEVSAEWDFTKSRNIVLCLNGYDITYTGSSNVSFIPGSTALNFTLTDCQDDAGSISGFKNTYGGAINVKNAFTMYNGKITGNTANQGGGVYVDQNATFYMYGGEITGNTAASIGGGVFSKGSMEVAGAPVVNNNESSNTATTYPSSMYKYTKNIYSSTGAIRVGTGGLATGALLDVTPMFPASSSEKPAAVAVIATGCTSDLSEYFTYTSGFDYIKQYDAAMGEVQLVYNPVKYTVTFDMQGHGTQIEPQEVETGTYALEPTPAPTAVGYQFGGWYTTPECGYWDDFIFDFFKITANTTLYAKWTEKATVSISEDVQAYTWDGNAKAFIISGNPDTNFVVQYKVNDNWTEAAPSAMGTYDVKITREEDTIYKAYEKMIGGGLVINAATPTVTVPTVEADLAYDGTSQSLIAEGTSENGHWEYSLDGTNYLTTVPAGTDAKTYTVYCNFVPNTGYAGVDPVELSVTITPKEVGLDWAELTAAELVYNGTAKTLTATATNLVVGDSCTVTVELVGDNINAGTFSYKATALSNANYKLPPNISSPEYTITPKTLIITAADKEEYVGNNQPELTYTVEGLVGSDVLITAPTLSTDANMYKAGTYAITFANEAAAGNNYSITYVNGTLTVKNYPYSPTVTPINDVKIADDITGGEVSASRKLAYKGTTITITIAPDAGYELAKLIVTDSRGNAVDVTKASDNTYTFKMPASKVTVKAAFAVENPFEDVSSDAYYYDAVLWAVKVGITSGTGATTFSPDNPCTRAQMATFLWRAAGSPDPVNKTCIYADVPADAYYATAVQWAYEQGITSGTGATTFSPDNPCTRAQMATFLWRAAGSPDPVSKTCIFADVPADAYYATAVQWAYEQGITSGTGATTYSPNDPCTRAQMVTFLYRYYVK